MKLHIKKEKVDISHTYFKIYKMRKLFAFMFFCGLFLDGYSQKINPAILLSNGDVVDNSHAFLDGETPTFILQNGTNENVKWKFCHIGKKAERVPVAESSTGESSFSFTITPNLFPRNVDKKRIEFPNDSSVYYSAVVELYKDGTLTDEMPLLLNVLPSRPKVTAGSLVGTFDYKIVGYDPLAHLSLSFKSDRMDHCELLFFAVKWDGEKYVPDWAQLGVYMDKLKKNNDTFQIEYEYLDCDEFFTICALNKYGGVNGDTICVNNYITDSKILDFLEKFNVDAIDDTSGDESEIVIHHNLISVEDVSSNDVVTEIYSLDGKLVCKNIAEKRVDISSLPKAAYIVKVKTRNKLLTKKFIKS